MKHTSRTRVLHTTLALLMIFSMLFAAGGTALAAPEDIDRIIIDINTPTDLVRGAKATMKATVKPIANKTLTEEEQKVKWSLSENSSTGTTINPDTGELIIAADETGKASNEITVTATSAINPTISKPCTIKISTDIVTKVEITEAPTQGSRDTTYNFKAKVTGAGTGYESVTWDMGGTTTAGSKLTSINGLNATLDVSASETLGSITVTVYSNLDPSKKASATILLVKNKFVTDVEILDWIGLSQIAQGVSKTLEAEVTSDNVAETGTDVLWSMTGATKPGTTLDANGVLTVDPKEPVGTVLTVTAKSAYDNSENDTKLIDVVAPFVSYVRIENKPAALSKGSSYELKGVIEGEGAIDDTLIWSLVGSHSKDTKLENGKLTVSGTEGYSNITVRVESKADTTKFDEATISIVEKKIDSVTILNAPAELSKSSVYSLQAEVKPIDANDATANKNVIWSISGKQAADTDILKDGRLIISADEPDGTIIVTATSEYDNSRSDSKEISIKTAKVNGITIDAVAAQARGAQVALTYTMDASGDISRDVTWKLEGNSSASTRFVSVSNLVIGADETTEALTVTATSVAVPSIQDSLSIKVKQIKSVVVSPASATAAPGSSRQFSAVAEGVNGADTSVVWSMQGNSSTNTTLDNGLLKVASDETANTIRVTATSRYDASKSSTVSVSVNTAKGWVKENGKWVYYNDDGSKATGWLKDGGKWYYLYSDGIMATGWQQINGKWYYLRSSGAMTTGWQNVGGKWYYMSGSGAMQTGWLKDGGKWYYLRSSGAMATGWHNVGGKWYYMSGSGAMQTGWLKDGGKWYYLNASGVMLTGRQRIGNKTYNFSSSGALS